MVRENVQEAFAALFQGSQLGLQARRLGREARHVNARGPYVPGS